jgi:outer membrane protein insertion porin family
MIKLWLLFFILASSSSAIAQNRKIDLSVLSATVQADVLKQIPSLNTNKFSRSDLDALVRYLVNQEQFDSVQIQVEDDGNSFFLNVGRARRISSIRFSGFSYLSEAEIQQVFAVPPKSVFDQQSLIEGGDRVRRLYVERGFQNAVVDLEFARLSATDIGVDIKIKENKQTLIQKIDLRANNPDFKNRFEKLLNKKLLKEPLTEQILSSVRKDIREEFSDRNYFKADLQGPEIKLSADESEAFLTFSVANSDEYFITYNGNSDVSSSDIKSALNLEQFYSSNPNIGPELAGRVKAFYLTEGYSRAEVSADDVEGTRAHQRRIVFAINEGAKVEIKEIKFVGRLSMPEDYYIEFIKEHSTDLIAGGYFTKSYYNREGIDLGLKNLIIDRQNQGFLKAKIVSVKTIYQGERKNQIYITVNLDEGPLTALESVGFLGNSSFSESELLAQIELRANEPLRLNKLEESVEKLKSFYQDSGYLEMSLVNEKEGLLTYSDDASTAKVRFQIYEGPKISVGSILIEGNSLTQDYVILKEVDFKAGDVLTPQKLKESTRRLQNLGHFNNVDIKTLEEKTQIAERTVVIRVADRNPGLFTLGVGANNEGRLTLRGYTGVAYRNINGTGRGAATRFEGNYNTGVRYLESKVTFGYLEPYLLNSRTNGRFNYTRAIYISDYGRRKATEAKQAVVSVEQNLTSHILLSYDIWNQAEIWDYGIDEGDPYRVGDVRTTIVTTGPTLDIDYRDHAFNPSTGTFTRLSAEYSSPNIGSKPGIAFVRTFASFTHYKNLGKPQSGWVLANSIRGGYLRDLSQKPSQDEDYGIPYDKKGLILGGQSTIRGFQGGEAFPNQFDWPAGADGSATTTDRFRLKGAANMYLIKSELRFPISGALGGAGFYDGGAVYVDGVNIKDPYRHSAGFALRYATPVGAASLEVAYKLDRNPDRSESQWPVYLSFGTF